MTQDCYTGVQGVVTYADAALADAMFDFTVTRGLASGTRSGKWSDLNKPGKVSVSGKITRIQRNADLLEAALNSTVTTGTATACLAATSFTAGTAVPITSDPATTSRLKVLTSNAATTLAGGFTIVGTDANDNYVSETIYIAAATPSGTAFYTSKAFKTANYAITDVITGTAKFQIDGVAASATVVVGSPKEFNLIGYVADGSNNITVTLSNCFFTGAKFSFTDSSAMLTDDMPFQVTDPDADVIVTGVDA
jgi:hypothetical protein